MPKSPKSIQNKIEIKTHAGILGPFRRPGFEVGTVSADFGKVYFFERWLLGDRDNFLWRGIQSDRTGMLLVEILRTSSVNL
jgi:hypothetical protein